MTQQSSSLSKIFVFLSICLTLAGLIYITLSVYKKLTSDIVTSYVGTENRDYTQYDNEKAIKVLFIGNSHTFYYDLDKLLLEISLTQESQHYHIYAEKVATAQLQSLKLHWQDGTALRKIQSRTWDYVILQDQSGMPLSGSERSIFLQYAKRFANAIHATGAKTLFYGTWPYQEKLFAASGGTMDPNFHYRTINSIYLKAAEKNNAGVLLTAPVRAYAPQDINLYLPDGNHTSIAGAYLNALAFYKYLFNIKKFDDDTFIPIGVDDSDGEALISHVENFSY